MAIWASSDWHCQPDKLKEAAVEWIKRGKAGNHRLIAVGDLFDILPLGRGKWRSAESMKELAAVLDGYPLEYVAGNHDPYPIVRGLMAPYPNITVLKNIELEEGGKRYLFDHGHRWSVDWGFLGINRIAPGFVEFMVDHAPGVWWWVCRRLGWLASRSNPGAATGKEKERINKLVMVIWGGATRCALQKDACVIIGHTHTAGRSQRGISQEQGFAAYLVDDGDIGDGTYVEIAGGDAQLKFLS